MGRPIGQSGLRIDGQDVFTPPRLEFFELVILHCDRSIALPSKQLVIAFGRRQERQRAPRCDFQLQYLDIPDIKSFDAYIVIHGVPVAESICDARLDVVNQLIDIAAALV